MKRRDLAFGSIAAGLLGALGIKTATAKPEIVTVTPTHKKFYHIEVDDNTRIEVDEDQMADLNFIRYEKVWQGKVKAACHDYLKAGVVIGSQHQDLDDLKRTIEHLIPEKYRVGFGIRDISYLQPSTVSDFLIHVPLWDRGCAWQVHGRRYAQAHTKTEFNNFRNNGWSLYPTHIYISVLDGYADLPGLQYKMDQA